MKRRDRWQDRKREREKISETDDGRETRKERRSSSSSSSSCSSFPFQTGGAERMIAIPVPRATRSGQAQLGRGTIEWKSRRVFRRGVAFGARTVEETEERGKKKEKHSTLSRAKWKSRENKDKLTVPGWMGRIHSVADCASRRRKEAPERKSDWVLILDCGRDETYKEQTVATWDWITR